ncbi:MAG TPA: SH3 domain-containing protein, partial [bacterium]|nr:SH3 domain-containing protein [bacterium]
ILNYERAQRLIPRYQDLQVNHKRVVELLEDEEFHKFQEGEAPLILRGLYRSMTLNELTLMIGVLLVAAAAVTILRWLWKRPSFQTLSNYLLSFLAIVVIILGATGSFRFRNEVLRSRAVVVSTEVDVRSGPGQDQGVVFTVHPGTLVQIHRRRENWVQVSLPNGYSGWLPGTDVQEVSW